MVQVLPEKRSAGRPRRLSLDAVIDAACAIGLDQLEMTTLASHLDTGVATLYGYVRSRDHLRQMVAQRIASKAVPAVSGERWQDLLRNHAQFCYSNFGNSPELTVSLLQGENGDAEVTYTQHLVSLLVKAGLQPSHAGEAYVAVTQIVIGAAVMRLRRQTQRDCSTGEQMMHLLDEVSDYRPALDRYIRDCENQLEVVERHLSSL